MPKPAAALSQARATDTQGPTDADHRPASDVELALTVSFALTATSLPILLGAEAANLVEVPTSDLGQTLAGIVAAWLTGFAFLAGLFKHISKHTAAPAANTTAALGTTTAPHLARLAEVPAFRDRVRRVADLTRDLDAMSAADRRYALRYLTELDDLASDFLALPRCQGSRALTVAERHLETALTRTAALLAHRRETGLEQRTGRFCDSAQALEMQLREAGIEPDKTS